jgi:hypothetical protein
VPVWVVAPFGVVGLVVAWRRPANRIISRTLAYAIVTGLLVGVYAGLVLLATQVFTGPGGHPLSGTGAPVGLDQQPLLTTTNPA